MKLTMRLLMASWQSAAAALVVLMWLATAVAAYPVLRCMGWLAAVRPSRQQLPIRRYT